MSYEDRFCGANGVFRPEWNQMHRMLVVLIAAVLSANLTVRAQHMNEKDSPCADVAVSVDLSNCLAKCSDTADAKWNGVQSASREARCRRWAARCDGAATVDSVPRCELPGRSETFIRAALHRLRRIWPV